jgi:hypothetical protein
VILKLGTENILTCDVIYQHIGLTLPRPMVTIRTTPCKGKAVDPVDMKLSCVRFEEEFGKGGGVWKLV